MKQSFISQHDHKTLYRVIWLARVFFIELEQVFFDTSTYKQYCLSPLGRARALAGARLSEEDFIGIVRY